MSGAVLLTNAAAVMTGRGGDAARAAADSVRLRDGVIEAVDYGLVAGPDDEVADVSGCAIYPGWVNTHHHLFQSVMKGVPDGINQPLFEWLGAVPHPRVLRLDEEMIELSATIGLLELLLSGTTTCADHHYAYHDGIPAESADVLFDVADRLGVRFVLARGGMTASDQDPDYPSHLVAESVDGITADVQRLANRYHQPGERPWRRVAMAPTTPTFSVTPGELREFARAGRDMGLRLHSHLSETRNYVDYCHEVHGCSPLDFCAEAEWIGSDVWFAHMVHTSDAEIAKMAQTGTGLAHCAQSNCRLGSGVAPVPAMAQAGVPVSLGVDGAASNEAADMFQETHTAWLVHRALHGAQATTVEEVIRWGTTGGAEVLGLAGVGAVEPGYAADLAVYDFDTPRYFGLHDPAIGPVVSGGAARLRHVLSDGVFRVRDGSVPGLDMAALRAQAQRVVRRLG